MIIYLYGQPASGKTTLANLIRKELQEHGYSVFHIDGDTLRDLTLNYDYSEEGRKRNMSNANLIATYIDKSKQIDYTILSVVSPIAEIREELKTNNDVVFFYLQTSADRGRNAYHVNNFEIGDHPSQLIDTDKPVEVCLIEIIHAIFQKQ